MVAAGYDVIRALCIVAFAGLLIWSFFQLYIVQTFPKDKSLLQRKLLVVAICLSCTGILGNLDLWNIYGLFSFATPFSMATMVLVLSIAFTYAYSVLEVQYLWLSLTPPKWIRVVMVAFLGYIALLAVVIAFLISLKPIALYAAVLNIGYVIFAFMSLLLVNGAFIPVILKLRTYQNFTDEKTSVLQRTISRLIVTLIAANVALLLWGGTSVSWEMVIIRDIWKPVHFYDPNKFDPSTTFQAVEWILVACLIANTVFVAWKPHPVQQGKAHQTIVSAVTVEDQGEN